MRSFIFSISLTLFQFSCGVPLSSIKQQVLDKRGGIFDTDEQGYSKWCYENGVEIDCPPYQIGRSLLPAFISEKSHWILYNSNCPKDKQYDLDKVLDENDMSTGSCTFKNVETRFFVHGFQPLGSAGVCGNVLKICGDFVDAYSTCSKIGDDWQFVCINWCALAGVWFGDSFDEGIYDKNAKRCLDIGQYYGNKLIDLAEDHDLDGTDFQIIGHSLGSHFAGTMARTFNAGWDKADVARVTGLDPAGPSFVQNAWGLKVEMIQRSDASFVQIIHTNGGIDPDPAFFLTDGIRLGDLHQLGDVDIYVNGGQFQPCTGLKVFQFVCSHRIAIEYYIDSINSDLPMARQCETVAECSDEQNLWGDAEIQMGEWAEAENHGNLYHQNLQCWSQGHFCFKMTTCYKCCQNDFDWVNWKGYRCNINEYD